MTKEKNSELLNEIQIYIADKKNNRTYLMMKNINLKVKNEMMKHSEMEIKFLLYGEDYYSNNKISEIMNSEKNFLYNNKFYIGVDLEKNNKTLFYGIITDIIRNGITNEITLNAKSISFLLDRTKQFVDFKTNYSIEKFVEMMKNLVTEYTKREADYENEETGYSQIEFNVNDEEMSFRNIMKYSPIIMYNETYWNFLIRFLYQDSLKIPIYVKGRKIEIGIKKLKTDEEEIYKGKLNWIENEIREYLEIGDYYGENIIYKSEIHVSDRFFTKYYYKSVNVSELNKNNVKVYSNIANYIEGKVVEVLNIENIDTEEKELRYRLEREKEQLKVRKKKLEAEKSELKENDEKRKSIDSEIENIDKLLSVKESVLEERKAKGNILGVKVDLSESLKKMGLREKIRNPEYREKLEMEQNGVYTDTPSNSDYYAYPILTNSGYSKGNVITIKPVVNETTVVHFRSITKGYIDGSLTNETRDLINNEEVKFNANHLEVNTETNISMQSKEKVSIKTKDIDYEVEE